jgi:hypothetical protein
VSVEGEPRTGEGGGGKRPRGRPRTVSPGVTGGDTSELVRPCQKPLCAAARKELQSVRLELEKERALRETLVAKAAAKDLSDMKAHVEQVITRMEVLQTERDREKNHLDSIRRHLTKKSTALSNQAEEIADLKACIAATTAELSDARAAEATRLRRKAAEDRAREKEERREAELSERLAKEETRIRNDLLARAQRAEEQAEDAVCRARDAGAAAVLAREEASTEANAARAANQAADVAEHIRKLESAKVERATRKAERLEAKLKKLAPAPGNRTVDEWAAMSATTARKAHERERAYLRGILTSHPFRPEDVATVLGEVGMVRPLFRTREIFDVHFEQVSSLMERLETSDYGVQFALYCHFELKMTVDQILRMVQGASKRFDVEHSINVYKPLLTHPWRADKVIKVRRPQRTPSRATCRESAARRHQWARAHGCSPVPHRFRVSRLLGPRSSRRSQRSWGA